MRLVAATVLALRREDARAEQLVNEAIAQYDSNRPPDTWTYDGTRRYLATARVSPHMRRVLTTAIKKVAP